MMIKKPNESDQLLDPIYIASMQTSCTSLFERWYIWHAKLSKVDIAAYMLENKSPASEYFYHCQLLQHIAGTKLVVRC